MSDTADQSLVEVVEETVQKPPSPEVAEGNEQPQEEQGADSSASREDVANIVASAFSRHAPAAPPKQMTEAEVATALRVANFDDDFATRFKDAVQDPDSDSQALVGMMNEMRDKFMDQSSTYSDLLGEQHRQEIEAKYQPVMRQVEAQRNAATRDRFFTAQPTLKNFEKLMPIAAKAVASNGKAYANEREEFAAVAAEAEKLIQTVRPEFKLGQTKGGGPNPASSMRGGGGGGGGDSSRRTTGADPSIL